MFIKGRPVGAKEMREKQNIEEMDEEMEADWRARRWSERFEMCPMQSL